MIGRVTLGEEAMLFDWRSRGGSQPHFHLDDATLPRNVAANATIRFLQSHVVSEATPEEWRQDFSKHLGTAKQSKPCKCRIMRDRGSCTRLVRFFRTNGPFLQSYVLCCLSAHKGSTAPRYISTKGFSVLSPEALSLQFPFLPMFKLPGRGALLPTSPQLSPPIAKRGGEKRRTWRVSSKSRLGKKEGGPISQSLGPGRKRPGRRQQRSRARVGNACGPPPSAAWSR